MVEIEKLPLGWMKEEEKKRREVKKKKERSSVGRCEVMCSSEGSKRWKK